MFTTATTKVTSATPTITVTTTTTTTKHIKTRKTTATPTTAATSTATATAATITNLLANSDEDSNCDNNSENNKIDGGTTKQRDDHDFNELTISPEDENHVCDISLMRIVDTTNSEASSNECDAISSDYGNDEETTNEFEKFDDEEGEVEVEGEEETEVVQAVRNRMKLYLNEVEINRRDEEKTITELVHASAENNVIEAGQNKSMRVAFGIILRMVLPLANGVVRGIRGIRDVRFLRVLRSIASSRQALTNLIAFAANTISMNLSSVQVSHRIEPILKILKIRKSRDGVESLPDNMSSGPITPSTPTTPIMYSPFIREPNGCSLDEPEVLKFCTLNILAEPPPGTPIRADIVFIHGLHGSLVNTWKQGLWENERQPVKFERPPKPPVRPPKRPRHSRTHLMNSHHKLKRARFAHRRCHDREMHEEFGDHHDHDTLGNDESESDFSFVCGEAKDIEICDGVEYSFPTFRLRMNDGGRLLHTELESMLQEGADETAAKNGKNNQYGAKDTNGNKSRSKKSSKGSNDEPENYSKCWPGDWLPLDCPGVRVIACNYTTDQYLWRPLWKKKEKRTNLIQRSREMAELLIQARVGYGHPIVWVGHSKGGLFVKQMIVDAWESGKPAMAPLWRSARGVFFYSVPHRGSHLASIKAPLLTRSVELLDIEKNSKYLLDLHRRFASLYHLGHLKIEVFSFVETALTLMSVLYLRIVGVDSADPGIGDVCGIRLDHREICKPRSRECILYTELVKMINKVC